MKAIRRIGIAVAALTIGIGPAAAQEAGDVAAEESAGALEEILVSARKRSETLHDVPLSVSAFSSDQLAAIGFRGLEDVALRTPGLMFSQQGGAIPGRYNCAIRFRGMNVSSEMPSYQVGALFIDGVYALSGCNSLGAEDIEQVEVIKGPQAAYFGRNTFGGAVNYITRRPRSEFDMKASADIGTEDDQEYRLSIEGPVVGDHLAGRVTGRFYDKGAQYIASDGGNLGAEKTRSIGISLATDPTRTLSARFRAFYSEDRDSAPAGGFISGTLFDSCSGTIGPDGVVRGRYFCGRIPSRASMGPGFISSNTSLDPRGFSPDRPNFLYDALVNNSWTLPIGAANPTSDPAQDGALASDFFGLKRNAFRISASARYELPNGWAMTAVAARNELAATWIRDYDLTDVEVWWSRDPQDMRDTSYELRLQAQSGRLDWLAGVSYYEQEFTGNGGGGTSVTRFPTATGFVPQVFTNGLNNNDEIRNIGVFGGLTYALNDQWKLSLEGRYQTDEMIKGQVAAEQSNLPAAKQKWETFLPRVILQWEPDAANNIYASFSQGVLPGDINASYVFGTAGMRSAQEIASLQQQVREGVADRPDLGVPGGTDPISGVDIFIDQEEIQSIELGWKRQWLNGRVQTGLAFYAMEWDNQKGGGTRYVIDFNGGTGNPYVADNPAACAGQPKPSAQPGGLFCDDVLRSISVKFPGSSRLKGIEFDGRWAVTDNLTVDGGIEWNDNEYTAYTVNIVEPIAGTNDMTGNRTPRYPEWKGNAAVTYNGVLPWSDASWYTRADLTYIGPYFIDESNLATAPSQTLVGAQFGVRWDKLRLELYGKNLTDEDNWAAASRWSDFTIPGVFLFSVNQGASVSPQPPRRFGIRLTYEY